MKACKGSYIFHVYTWHVKCNRAKQTTGLRIAQALAQHQVDVTYSHTYVASKT